MNLTEFQKNAVENAWTQLNAANGSGRFLIADEVGLGKTIIAREIVSKLLEETLNVHPKKNSVTVVYICSNQLLARKNLKKLAKKISRWEIKVKPASRLSLLALDDPHLIKSPQEPEKKVCYFYALTPGTSLNITNGNGTIQERMMLYLLAGGNIKDEINLDDVNVKKYGTYFDREKRQELIFKGWKRRYNLLQDLQKKNTKNDPWYPFVNLENLDENPDITAEVIPKIKKLKGDIRDINSKNRDSSIFKQRRLLTEFGASLLQPDLVIFDEFQRYEDIFIAKQQSLDADKEAARAEMDIINSVFARLSTKPKYLLLSATPFEPLTRKEEIDRGEVSLDSCTAFTKLIEWLLGPGNKRNFSGDNGVWKKYSDMFKEYCQTPDPAKIPALFDQKKMAETIIRSVMSRTERDPACLQNLVENIDKSESVLSGQKGCKKRVALFLSDLNEAYGKQLLEFEKYSYKPLSSMRTDYKFIKQDERPAKAFLRTVESLKDEVDSPYFLKLRDALGETKTDYSLLLWMPPTVPFYELKGPFKTAYENGFSKILIFSAWRYIPRMVSAAMSNHVEREIWGHEQPEKLDAYHFGDKDDNGQFRLKSEAKYLLKPDYENTSLEYISRSPAKSIYYALMRLFPDLEKEEKDVCRKWSTRIAFALLQRMLRSDGVEILKKSINVEILKKSINKDISPEQLAAEYCHAGCFAAVAYEYLYLLFKESHAKNVTDTINEICRVFYDTLKLKVHTIKLDFCNGEKKEIESKPVRLHFADCFSEREKDSSSGSEKKNQTESNAPAQAEQSSPEQADNVAVSAESAPSAKGKERSVLPDVMKAIYGEDICYSAEDTAEEDSTPIRNDTLQAAFNSPFKPFVLTTTSIGQEGLDFHWYCRKIMHWNLPSNPVDFDQREGRINRHGSFALRQTLAEAFLKEFFKNSDNNEEKFSWDFSWDEFWNYLQKKYCDDDANGMIPYWLPPKPKDCKESTRKIERIIPFYPLSREHLFIDDLLKLQAIYRMVIGQPHQDELLSLLRDLSEEDRKKIMECTIRLAPPEK